MGPLSMNRNDLTGIPDTPKFGYSAVNRKLWSTSKRES